MATNFPSSLDSLTNPTATDGLDSPSHSDQHINANDAVEELEKVTVGPVVYNVQGYGAKGDNSTDDTTAIQSAINAAAAAGTGSVAGGMVFFPPGTYNITSPLDIPANANGLAIVGVNQRVSTIEQQTSNVPVLRANHGPTHSIKIHGLTLSYATQQTTAETDAYCLQWAKTEDAGGNNQYFLWSVSDLHLQGGYVGMGIRHLDTGESIPLWGMYFESIWIQDYAHEGMKMTSPVSVGMPNNVGNHIYFICQSTTPDSYAIRIGAGEWRFTGVEANVLPDRFFYMSSQLVTFHGLHLEIITVTENNAHIMEVANGNLLVTDFKFDGEIDATGVDIFRVSSAGNLSVDGFTSETTMTSGDVRFLDAANGDGVYVRRFQQNSDFSASDLSKVRHFETEGDAVQPFTDGDATPAVLGFYAFTTANTGATTITDFDEAHPGQLITVIVGDANTTFANSASLVMASGENWVASDGDVLQFVYDGSAWNQIDSDITSKANTWSADQAFSGDLLHSGTNAGFFGASTGQLASTADIKDVLVALGFLPDSGATPLDLDGGNLTAALARAGDGSAGAPAFAFTNNTNLGFFRAAANTLAIATHGLKRFEMFGSNLNIPSIAAVELRLSGEQAGTPIRWGPGDSSLDTNLYRDSANVLKTDDSLHVGADLSHLGTNAGFFGAFPVVQQGPLTAEDAGVVNSGDATTDAVINNLRTRVGELEAALQAYGLLT